MIKPYITQEEVDEEIRIAEEAERERELEKIKMKGIQEGEEKGMEKGIEKGSQDTIFAIAKKMIQENADLSFIEKITGISKDKLMML